MPEIERIMERICDLCHHPYVETDQEALDEICNACTLEAEILELVHPVTINQAAIAAIPERIEKLEEYFAKCQEERRRRGIL